MVDIHQLVSEHKELVVNTRRDLHQIPETAYTEKKTSAYVTEYLNK
jgi:metal-dependent amidase/aminoacylase/carboxypeptidase family protein